MRKILIRFYQAFKILCWTSGLFFIIMLILSFTTTPFYAYHWLGTSVSEIETEPEYVVFLGGGGMPSQSNLMRSYYTVHAAKSFSESKIILSMPGDLLNDKSTPNLVHDELVLRGVDASRILFEPEGTNTRSQALKLKFFDGTMLTKKPILLVTSPEHMRRAVLSFRKAGFEYVNALPAFENALEADLKFTDDELGGNKLLVPDVGKSISFRYQFWNHLKYEILVAREMAAMVYYKMRAWI